MATKAAVKRKMSKVWGEYEKGELNVGRSDKKVSKKKQAVAIMMSMKRKMTHGK